MLSKNVSILILIPIAVLAAFWIWMSWVFSNYQLNLDSSLFDGKVNFFTVQSVALYVTCFVFAYTISTRRASIISGALVLIFSYMAAWLMVIGLGDGWYLKLGTYVTALLAIPIFREGAIAMGIFMFPIVHSLTSGCLLGIMVFLAARWISARPLFKEGAALELMVHIVGFSCAQYILFHYTADWNTELRPELKEYREVGATISSYAATLFGVFMLPPLAHISCVLIHRTVCSTPSSTIRSNRAIIVASCIILLAGAVMPTLSYQLQSSGYGPGWSVRVIFWPYNVLRSIAQLTENPEHDTPLAISGYRLAIGRDTIKTIWDQKSQAYHEFQIRYPIPNWPVENRQPPMVGITRVDAPTKWRRLTCDESYDEVYLRCGETSNGLGNQQDIGIPNNWWLDKDLVLRPKDAPDVLILASGRTSDSAKNPPGILLLLARDDHPEIVYTIRLERARKDDWASYASALNEFVDQYVIAPDQ